MSCSRRNCFLTFSHIYSGPGRERGFRAVFLLPCRVLAQTLSGRQGARHAWGCGAPQEGHFLRRQAVRSSAQWASLARAATAAAGTAKPASFGRRASGRNRGLAVMGIGDDLGPEGLSGLLILRDRVDYSPETGVSRAENRTPLASVPRSAVSRCWRGLAPPDRCPRRGGAPRGGKDARSPRRKLRRTRGLRAADRLCHLPRSAAHLSRERGKTGWFNSRDVGVTAEGSCVCIAAQCNPLSG